MTSVDIEDATGFAEEDLDIDRDKSKQELLEVLQGEIGENKKKEEEGEEEEREEEEEKEKKGGNKD